MDKYRKGRRILTLEELMQQEVVFFRDKPLNKAFFQNWQLRYALNMINRNLIFYAFKDAELTEIDYCYGANHFKKHCKYSEVCDCLRYDVTTCEDIASDFGMSKVYAIAYGDDAICIRDEETDDRR